MAHYYSAVYTQRQPYRRDVVANGVLVAIVEHKNPMEADAIERGITYLHRSGRACHMKPVRSSFRLT